MMHVASFTKIYTARSIVGAVGDVLDLNRLTSEAGDSSSAPLVDSCFEVLK